MTKWHKRKASRRIKKHTPQRVLNIDYEKRLDMFYVIVYKKGLVAALLRPMKAFSDVN